MILFVLLACPMLDDVALVSDEVVQVQTPQGCYHAHYMDVTETNVYESASAYVEQNIERLLLLLFIFIFILFLAKGI